MYQNKTFLAIIPARGGSKRLPKKNVLDLAGKPLIAWSIEAGIKSKYIDKLVVTSDSDEIIKTAQEFGIDTIKRPNQLASDTAKSVDVVKHVIDNVEKYDYIVLLQPTSPLRNRVHIDESIESMVSKKLDSIISVCETSHSPLWCNTLSDDGSMDNFLDKSVLNKRSQDLKIFYRINGAIYICKTSLFERENTFFLDKNSGSYIMDIENSVDVDVKYDLIMAEILLTNNDQMF
jgi:CMP-N,N'-diacetyllegionaminic acid synthase